MKALVLAAGCGRRLRPLTAATPKCLLRIDGTTILGHQLHGLRRTGVESVVVVCGHGVEAVRQQLVHESAGLSVRIAYNPFYSVADNLVSLWTARAELDEDLVLLNGDAVFHPRVFELLAAGASPCCLLLARRPMYSGDDMKVHLEGDRVAAIGKDLAADRTDAAAVGALRFCGTSVERLRRELDQSMLEPDSLGCHFPAVIQRLADHGQHVDAIDIGDLAWADVDTPADLCYVREHFYLFRDCAELEPEPREA